MAYELHIKPHGHDYGDPSTHISAEDFRAAVAMLPDCRCRDRAETVGRNPATGEEIRIATRGVVAEVRFPGRKGWFRATPAEWIEVFHLGGGAISFKAAFDPDDPADPVRRNAARLARRLQCTIEGDDGETYEW